MTSPASWSTTRAARHGASRCRSRVKKPKCSRPGSWGPFLKGVIEGQNPHLDTDGSLRWARNAYMNGLGQLVARPGTELAFTLLDETDVPVTSVVAITNFSEGALAVGHSTITDKFYLYRFNADMDTWFDAGSLAHVTSDAEPVAELWSAAPDPEKVSIAEGLGEAFIAHGNAGSAFRSKRYSVAGGLADLEAALRPPTGIEPTYFRGLAASTATSPGAGAMARRRRARTIGPSSSASGCRSSRTSGGGYFAAADSLTVGHNVRSFRERVVAAVVCGEVLYVGTPNTLWPITGFGRNSWDKGRPLDDSFGFAGPYAAVSANGVLYYWSARGPMRVAGLSRPEPPWDVIPTPRAASSIRATSWRSTISTATKCSS